MLMLLALLDSACSPNREASESNLTPPPPVTNLSSCCRCLLSFSRCPRARAQKQPKPRKGGRGGGRAAASAAAASKRFLRQLEKDRAKFSLDRGRNRFVQRARARLQELPGAMNLVKSMASFVPDNRPTMLEVMRSDVFSAFRRRARAAGGDGDAGRARGGSRCVDFMAFARGEGDAPLLAL